MLRSSIDLGTNTCLLLVVDWDPSTQKIRTILGDFAQVVRLGQGVDLNRRLQEEAMIRTLDCLKTYQQQLKMLGGDPKDTVAVATSQARDASNGREFFERVQRETGFKFQTLTGEEEAQASFRGALGSLDLRLNAYAVMDIGGGSTEFISTTGATSLDVGSVRFTERYLKTDPVSDSEFWKCQEAIDHALSSLRSWRESLSADSILVAVAGTATTLAQWFLELKEFDPEKIHGMELSRGDLHRLVEELKWRTAKERASLPGIEPMRADVLLAGAMIYWRAMEVLDFQRSIVSVRGLRYGVLYKETGSKLSG